MDRKRYKVRLNSETKVEELLQETYDLAIKQQNEIQNEMNKLINSTNLADATIEEKTKYAKAMNDYFNAKSKSIAMKFEIAKFLGELLKHNGDVNKTLNDPNVVKATKIDLASLREEINKEREETVNTYELKRK
jgi:uncharacterized protein (DUF885 family)